PGAGDRHREQADPGGEPEEPPGRQMGGDGGIPGAVQLVRNDQHEGAHHGTEEPHAPLQGIDGEAAQEFRQATHGRRISTFAVVASGLSYRPPVDLFLLPEESCASSAPCRSSSPPPSSLPRPRPPTHPSQASAPPGSPKSAP